MPEAPTFPADCDQIRPRNQWTNNKTLYQVAPALPTTFAANNSQRRPRLSVLVQTRLRTCDAEFNQDMLVLSSI
jgi:hypothetical protein